MPVIYFISYIITEEYLWYPKAIFNIIYLYILFYCGDLNAICNFKTNNKLFFLPYS